MHPVRDEDRLLLVPGPTPVIRDILAAMSKPTISHTSKEFAGLFIQALERLARLMGNPMGKTFVFSGSGTLAQEAALLNFVEPSDRLLVISNGFFADRLLEIAKSHGLPVAVERAEWGTFPTPDTLRERIREAGATVVAFTHVETSTGAMAPLAEAAKVIRAEGAFSIVDGVAGLGGVSEDVTEYGLDVLLSGSQKALGVPPGLVILGATEAAWEKRRLRRSPVHTFYADLERWRPIMESPDRYFSTHPVNLIYALAKAMDIVFAEGICTRYERHKLLATSFRDGLSRLGFEPFTHAEYLAPTLSVVRTPDGMAASAFREKLYSAGVVAASGIGDQEDRIVRFGHMGNIGRAEIAVALDAAGQSLN